MSKKFDWDGLFKSISIERIRAKKWDSRGKIFPSWAGTNCELKLRHQFLGTEERKTYEHHGKENKIGDKIHEEIQKDFVHRFKDKVEIEKYITLEIAGLKINGKVDVILNKALIIEIKTVKSTEGNEPEPDHIKQVQWYMGVLGLKKTMLSYFDRQNGIHINSFEIGYDENVFNAIKEKFERVITGSIQLRSDTRECNFCPFGYTCQSYKRPQWKKKNGSEQEGT